MGTLNPPPRTFKDGDDDFDFLTFVVTGNPAVLQGMLRQSPEGGGEPIESSETLAALPVAALGGITKAQFRAALRGYMLHLRTKAGIV